MYQYIGLHWFCKLLVSLTLLSASPSTGHVAAFVTAQDRNTSEWVQAGVELQTVPSLARPRPFLYVEWRWAGKTHLVLLAWAFGRTVNGHLEHRGDFWRAGVRGLWTPWLRLNRTEWCSGLELYRGAHGMARVGARLLTG